MHRNPLDRYSIKLEKAFLHPEQTNAIEAALLASNKAVEREKSKHNNIEMFKKKTLNRVNKKVDQEKLNAKLREQAMNQRLNDVISDLCDNTKANNLNVRASMKSGEALPFWDRNLEPNVRMSLREINHIGLEIRKRTMEKYRERAAKQNINRSSMDAIPSYLLDVPSEIANCSLYEELMKENIKVKDPNRTFSNLKKNASPPFLFDKSKKVSQAEVVVIKATPVKQTPIKSSPTQIFSVNNPRKNVKYSNESDDINYGMEMEAFLQSNQFNSKSSNVSPITRNDSPFIELVKSSRKPTPLSSKRISPVSVLKSKNASPISAASSKRVSPVQVVKCASPVPISTSPVQAAEQELTAPISSSRSIDISELKDKAEVESAAVPAITTPFHKLSQNEVLAMISKKTPLGLSKFSDKKMHLSFDSKFELQSSKQKPFAKRLRLIERLRYLKIEIPPLCSCGLTIHDESPSQCIESCQFFENQHAFNLAIEKIYHAVNSARYVMNK